MFKILYLSQKFLKMKGYIFILLFILQNIVNGQSILNHPIDYQIIDSTKFDELKGQVTLHWNDNFAMFFDFKNDNTQDAFRFCPNPNKTFTFTIPENGKDDYLIVSPFAGNLPECAKLLSNAGNNYLPLLKDGNHDEFKGRILVLVDSTLAQSILSELDQLQVDLVGDGYIADFVHLPSSYNSKNVKSLIVNYKNLYQDLSTLYLIGNIAFAESGNYNLDGHLDHTGAQLADYFYADLDGVWTDTVNYPGNGINNLFQNIANDGKFDQTMMPSNPEISVGRIFFDNLPVFNEDEATLTKRYLKKAHDHKIHKGAIDKTFYEGMTTSGYNYLYTLYYDLKGKPSDLLIGNDILTDLKDKSVLIGLSNGTGGPSIQFSGFNSEDLASKSINAKIMFLTGSYFYDLRYENNLIRSLLASNSPTVSVYYSLRKFAGITYAGNGYPLATAAIKLFDDTFQPFTMTPSNLYTGDPTIKLKIINQISGLQIENEKNKVIISWTKNQDAEVNGYKVYRSNSKNGPFEPLMDQPQNSTEYIDYVPTIGKYYYMVRAVKKEYSRSASFWNYSTGQIADIEINEISSIDNISSNQIILYPNPAKQEICFDRIIDIKDVQIFDVYGKLVQIPPFESNCLNVNNLNSGTYIISLTNIFGENRNYKFLKI